MKLPTLLTCAALTLSCLYEPPTTPDAVAENVEWVRYDAAHQFVVDFPRPPLFKEVPLPDGLVMYSLSTLHNDTLFHLTYVDHPHDITPVIAYHTATSSPGVYNAKLGRLANQTALTYSQTSPTTLEHAAMLIDGARMYVLTVSSRHVVDMDGWARFKHSFNLQD